MAEINELVNKLEKFMDEVEVFFQRTPLHSSEIGIDIGRLKFRGEAVDIVVTKSPINLIVGLRDGSVGLISAVICAFSAKFGKPYMIYMARDCTGHTEITTHFLTAKDIDPDEARLMVLLAEFLSGVENITLIDFSEVEKEAERYLSQYF
jgi:hypothetical protein